MKSADSRPIFPRLAVTNTRSDSDIVAIVPDNTVNLDAHLALYGRASLLGSTTQDLVALLRTAEIHGRGGAGFPMSQKIASYAKFGGEIVIIANGSESEPLSSKDETLLRHQPHLVLDGISIVANALSAKTAYLVTKGKNQDLAITLKKALEQRRMLRMDKVRVLPFSVDSGYSSGVEAAIIPQINGKGSKPAYFPSRPIGSGVGRKPTLVANVESLAHLALLYRLGTDWFQAVGSGGSGGTRLHTIVTPDQRYQVVEVVSGTKLAPVLDYLGIDRSLLTCALIGGYYGTLIDRNQIESFTLGDQPRQGGISLGAGIIALSRACPVREVFTVVSYLASQSAGQCGPCFNGLPALADQLRLIDRSVKKSAPLAEAIRIADQIMGRGGCAMPDGAVVLTRSLISGFKEELRIHERGGCSMDNEQASFVLKARERASG